MLWKAEQMVTYHCRMQIHRSGQHFDKAGEEHCKLLIYLRTVWFQAAPFWHEAWPDMYLWNSAAFHGIRRTFRRWAKVQTGFVRSMRETTTALLASGSLPLGSAPGVLLGNAIYHNKVCSLPCKPAMELAA